MVDGDDVAVARRRHVYVGERQGVFHGDDAVAFHRGLKRAYGVDFGDEYRSPEPFEGLHAALADVSVAAHEGDFARDHDVCRALYAVYEGFAAAVYVVEFALRDGIVDVDGRKQQPAVLDHLVEPVDSCGGLLGDSPDFGYDLVPMIFIGGVNFFKELFYDLLLLGAGGGVDPPVAVFELVALVDEQSGVAAVVHYELRAPAVRPR